MKNTSRLLRIVSRRDGDRSGRRRYSMRGCSTFLSLVALTLFPALASLVATGGKHGSTKKRITESQCERLVAQLVNPDKPPFKEHYVLELPRGQSESILWQRQQTIGAAYDKLSANIEVSLPVLMKHVHDDRFSYVYEEMAGTSGGYLKASVGYACRRIVGAHVEVHYRSTTKYVFEGTIPRSMSFIDSCGGFDKWWKSRKRKSLAELQLEGLEWVLRQKKPRHFKSEREWARALKSVREMARQIRSSRKPIRVAHTVSFFSK
jgi:hypothetical protein